MRTLTRGVCLAAAVIITAAYGLDFAGYAYYAGYCTTQGDNIGYPINGGSVTLWKMTAESGWEQIGSPVATNPAGYYHFDDVNGAGVTWFKIRVDATDKIPNWTQDWWVQERAVKNVVRPQGIPDAGIIRVDVILAWNYGLRNRPSRGIAGSKATTFTSLTASTRCRLWV